MSTVFRLNDEGSPQPRPEDVAEGHAIPVNQVVITLRKCGRCGERHRNLVWREFKLGPARFDNQVVASHWATCPVTGEPVLGLLLEDEYLRDGERWAL